MIDSLPRDLLLHVGRYAPLELGRLSMASRALWWRMGEDQRALCLQWLRSLSARSGSNAALVNLLYAQLITPGLKLVTRGGGMEVDRHIARLGIAISWPKPGILCVESTLRRGPLSPCALCNIWCEADMQLPTVGDARCHMACLTRAVMAIHGPHKQYKYTTWARGGNGQCVLGMRLEGLD